ncbi:phage tail tape measure protein [Deinococcus alpinitundrae]|uniref:phage tail tape measure protein n=1 Tax=Deinococcus alpinitundrae TaxID=468913 RepID=UPI001379E120|nr:phage tail tape measure protein [Deinococcus alpinitundrae]
MESTLGSLVASTALDLSGFFAGLNRVREESNKIGTVQVKTGLDTTAMRAEIARTSTSWKDLQGIADQATRTVTRNLGGAGNEATNLRNQLRQAGSEFRTMDADAAATKAKVAGIVAEARALKPGFEAGTAEARVLTGVIEQGRAALGTARSSTSPVINQLRQEQALAREAVQDVNNYRIAWQRKANDDATTASIMKRLEAGILSQKNAIDAEIASLRSLGVLEEQDQARVTALIAQRNTFNNALRTTSSVQMQIAGEIQKGSLAASVAAGTEATALKNLTGNTKFLLDQQRAGTLVGNDFKLAMEGQTLALRTQMLAVQAEATALKGLGVNTAQETVRLAELTAAERALVASAAAATAALLQQNAAAKAAAAAPLRAGLGAAGAGKASGMNSAAMALSFISPQAGMIAMAASMGPVVAGAAAVGLALGGVVKLTKDGQDEAKKLQQAYLVMSANGIRDIDKINAELNDMVANGSDAERMFSKSELATALAALARGGVKGSDALTVLKVSSQLAAAEHIKLSEATERLYGNLQHLDMTADEASGFGDKLARASHLSMASMDNLSKGLNVAGATAHTMGFSVEETLAMLVRLAQKGMDPATIGATGLRNAMQKVLTPSKDAAAIYAQLGVNMEDSTGHMRSGRDIMQDLQKVFSSTAPVYSKTTGEIITSNDLAAMSFRIFGTRSATAFLSTLGNLKDMTAEVKNSGGFLTTYSGTVVSGLEGSQKRLDAATKNLSLTFAKTFTPALTAAATAATTVLTEVNKVLAIFDGNKSPKELQLSLKITSADSGTEKILKLFMGGFAGLSAVKAWAMPNDKGPAAQGRAEEVQSRLVNLGVLQEKSGADKLKQFFAILDKLPMYEAMLNKKIAQVGAAPLNVPGMTGFGGPGPLAAPPGAGSTGNWNVVGAALLGNTGNLEADTVAGWCARWVRLTLDKAEPHAAKQIEKFFAGDANDIKTTATNSKKLRTDLKQLQPGDVVVYDDNHVGIYVGKQMIDGKMQDAVRGNNRWGTQHGRDVVSTEKMTSLGPIAGYVRVGDVTGSAAAAVPQRDPNWKAPAADPKLRPPRNRAMLIWPGTTGRRPLGWVR